MRRWSAGYPEKINLLLTGHRAFEDFHVRTQLPKKSEVKTSKFRFILQFGLVLQKGIFVKHVFTKEYLLLQTARALFTGFFIS